MLMTARRWTLLGTVAVAGLGFAFASMVPANAAVQTSAKHLSNEIADDRCLEASGESSVRLADTCTDTSRRLWRFSMRSSRQSAP